MSDCSGAINPVGAVLHHCWMHVGETLDNKWGYDEGYPHSAPSSVRAQGFKITLGMLLFYG